MRPSSLLLSSFLATLRSSSRTLLALLLIFLSFPGLLRAQADSLKVVSTVQEINKSVTGWQADSLNAALRAEFRSEPGRPNLTPEQKKRRTWLVAAGNVIGYGGTMVGLYSAWYKDYPQTRFHSFNDWPEWKQVDKVGHFYSAYIESFGSNEMWRWTGMERKKRIWIGGMSGAVYQTVIEVLDGFSAGWGWSWGDFGANIIGSSSLVAQEFAWNEQRIKFKFSFHTKSYNDPELNRRSDKLFGETVAQRFIKDYNGQTYWASANLRSFFPASNLPPWLSLSLGYGAEGLFGGTRNVATDVNGNIIFNRPDIKRYRQWYLAPDIDLTKIKTKSKAIKFALGFLSAFKFPAPALEFSNGKWKVHGLYF